MIDLPNDTSYRVREARTMKTTHTLTKLRVRELKDIARFFHYLSA
jgi:hypothetical protein